MKTLDPLTIPLEGLNLIEASAGTGKTYAISNLYLQLLVVKDFKVEEILVVTFTKAATEELKGRIRKRIVDGINALSGIDTTDEFLKGFVEKTSNRARAQRSLTNALRSFDLAAIFTIHGFCLRMLYNHAFESASLFDTGLVEDQTEVLAEIVDDFWRRTFYPMESHTFMALAPEMTREKLLALARKCISNPLLVVDGCAPTEMNPGIQSKGHELSIVGLRKRFIDYVRIECARRKRDENVRSYDDLLIDFYHALEGQGGKELSRSIRSHYKAALVDEFQDTDPLQYKIFRTIYSGGEGALFLIGDPKQSIYSFRGADIFSYLEAVNDVDNRYTLAKNWRSTGGLIKAVNAIFGGDDNPFIFESLNFQPVEQGDTDSSSGAFTIEGMQDQSPFKIWFMKREQGKKNIAKTVARSSVCQAVADEIVSLLSEGSEGRVKVDGRPIHAGDIAILVHTNWEAREMLRFLKDSRVPGVIYSAESIFGSHEAMEIERILSAVLEPANEAYVKSALTTDIIGLSGDDLAAMLNDEKAWDGWVERFESYRSLFMSQGFIAMARDMFTREEVKQRLRAFPDGERRVTNVLHCVELLHTASVDEKLATEGLLKWLQEKRKNDRASESDEYQMRLETDEKAVKIATIHKSKGLEYPVVFCPFSWNSAHRGKESAVVYHDIEKENQPTIDIGCPASEKAKKSMERERLAENIRLLYVTLTRAKYRCYLVWGPINESETSALAYLFHYSFGQQEPLDLIAMKNFVKSLNDESMIQDVRRFVHASGGTIELTLAPLPSGLIHKPPQQEIATLRCRQFTAEIEKNWRTTSFTALISGKEQLAETPDHDIEMSGSDLPVPPRTEKPSGKGNSIFEFPRGARPGTCLHDIFEHIDFNLTNTDEAKSFVEKKLSEYGFENLWTDTVYTAIEQVLTTPIMGEGSPFTLSRLTPAERLHEVEFYTPMGLISPDKLAGIFRSQPLGCATGEFFRLVEGLGFAPHKGMLRGFIDMVFSYEGRYYLVDWKSNFLGENPEDYEQTRINWAMEKELYILQYHIYAVALHRFLEARIKDYHYSNHFGGIFYLFIRGMDPLRGSRYGVFFDKPHIDLIDGFAHCLEGRNGE